MNTINGRTPEEIKRGLEACTKNWCMERMCKDALDYIRQLERERDAAVEQLRRVDKEDLFGCTHCKHNVRCSEILLGCNGCDNSECPCNTCVDSSNWQWRGVQQEVE